MVALLSQTGMSTRDIAPVAGASKSVVAEDVKAGVQNRTPADPVEIAGRDGKTYTRPEPKPERSDYVPPLRFPQATTPP